jgi:hypothetical protein
MPLYTFIHSLLNVLVQIANKMGLQKNLSCSLQPATDRDPKPDESTHIHHVALRFILILSLHLHAGYNTEVTNIFVVAILK